MAYDQDKDEVTSSVTNSDLPDTVKAGVTQALASSSNVSVESVTVEGAISETTSVAQVTTGGNFTASSNNRVLLFDTNEAVTVTVNQAGGEVTPPQQVIVLGGGDDSVNFGASGSARVVEGENLQAAEAESTQGSTIEGAAGDDSISGSTGDDSISGGQGDDSISGGAGDDVITAGSGNDTVDGGAGFDVVNLQAGRSSYNISVNEETGDLILSTSNETQTLNGIEFVSFDDGTIVSGVSNQDQGDVVRLYEVMLDREAEAEGLEFWLNKHEDGASLQDIALGFQGSDEYQAGNQAESNSDFLEDLYQRAFERESDAEGKAYWLDQMNNSGISRADVEYSFAQSDEAIDDFDYIQVIGTNLDLG